MAEPVEVSESIGDDGTPMVTMPRSTYQKLMVMRRQLGAETERRHALGRELVRLRQLCADIEGVTEREDSAVTSVGLPGECSCCLEIKQIMQAYRRAAKAS